MSPWLMVLPVGGLGWWMLGFPPGWGWLVLPMIPSMPVSFGMLLVLATVVIGAYAGLAWVRNSLFDVGFGPPGRLHGSGWLGARAISAAPRTVRAAALHARSTKERSHAHRDARAQRCRLEAQLDGVVAGR